MTRGLKDAVATRRRGQAGRVRRAPGPPAIRRYAHPDKWSGRNVVERADVYDDELTGFGRVVAVLDRDLLRTVIAPICDQEERRFQEAASALVRAFEAKRAARLGSGWDTFPERGGSLRVEHPD
jgi:hypothetical protein